MRLLLASVLLLGCTGTAPETDEPDVAPSIVAGPEARMATAGDAVAFTVTATGSAPLRYQWRKDGAALAGATGARLDLAGAREGDAGSYDVVVSNDAGSATSAPARLTVTPRPIAPSIVAQPESRTVTAGQPASLGVVASGTAPLVYQWRKDGAPVAGAAGATLALADVRESDAGAYDVVVANAAGSVTSERARLTVNPRPIAPAITAQPQGMSVTEGEAARFAVAATGSPPLAYQWRKEGQAIAGATAAELVVAPARLADRGGYDVVVSNAAGSVTSDRAVLDVQPPLVAPAITAQPQPVAVVVGGQVSLSVTAAGSAPLFYRWRKDGVTVGASSPTLSIAAARESDTGLYDVIVSNDAGSAKSDAVPVTVMPLPAEHLTADDLARLDGAPGVAVRNDQIVLPNRLNVQDYLLEVDPAFLQRWAGIAPARAQTTGGLGPQDRKNQIIARMQVVGNWYVTRSLHVYPAGSDPARQPAQNGFAYSYGRKDALVRQRPAGACTQEVHGLDCSGFVAAMARAAGLPLVEGNAAAQATPDAWETALAASGLGDRLKVEDLGKLPATSLQTGDVVAWRNAAGRVFHIGVVLSGGPGLALFMSNGTDGYDDDVGCGVNIDPRHGPVLKQLTPFWFDGFGASYSVLRIVVDISGDWDLYLRCAGLEDAAIVAHLTLPVDDGGSFTASGAGVDYDGETGLILTLDGSYDPVANHMTATLTTTFSSGGEPRMDYVDATLDRDDTGYFAVEGATNGGCPAEARLVKTGN